MMMTVGEGVGAGGAGASDVAGADTIPQPTIAAARASAVNTFTSRFLPG